MNILNMAMLDIKGNRSVARDVAQRLGITTTTLYAYVNSYGSHKDVGTKLLEKATNNK